MTFAISIVLKGTLVCSLVLALLFALKKSSAAARHWIISLSMASLLLLPAFQLFTPNLELEMPVVEQITPLKNTFIAPAINAIISSPVNKEITAQQNNYAPTSLVAAPTTSSTTFVLPNMPFALQWSQLLLGVWLLGFGFFFFKMLLGVLGVWQITKRAKSFSLRSEHQNLLALRRKVQYLLSDEINTPMTWGIFAPKILLPSTHSTWTSDEMRVVLLHELSHIKRHDYAWHLLGIATLSLYWMHPLVWILQKWQQSEREQACDEYVLQTGVSKTDYAAQLVKVARQLLNAKDARWSASLPMAQTSQTKKRVFAILRFDASTWQFTSWLQWRWIGFFACCLPLLAAVHPTSRSIIEESIPQIEATLEQPIFEISSNLDTPILQEETKPNSPVTTAQTKQESIRTSPQLSMALPNLEVAPSEIVIKQKTVSQTINTPETQDVPLGYYGRWERGYKPTIQIWTRGTFDVLDEAPYFVNLSEDALIIVHISGRKREETLVVGKASTDGTVQTNVKRKLKRSVEKGETLYSRLKKGKEIATSTYQAESGFEEEELWENWIKQFRTATKMMHSFENDGIWQSIQSPQTKEFSDWNQMIKLYETGILQPVENPDRKVKYKGRGQILKMLKVNKNKEKIKAPEQFVHVPSGILYEYEEEKNISMKGFFMHETEVTNKNYREFLADMQRNGSAENWDDIRIHDENWKVAGKSAEAIAKHYHQHLAYDNYPVVNISYEGALAYCKWLETKLQATRTDGKKVHLRLPTREEWMYAAHGGHSGAPFPWGAYYLRNSKGCYLCNFKPIDESQLRYDAKADKYEVASNAPNHESSCFDKDMLRVTDDGGKFTVIVDAYFPNDYGLYNMSGNVAEMLQSKGSTKGGSWNSTGYSMQIGADDEYAGWSEASPFIGFRPILVIE